MISSEASRRGRASRNRGVRFERAIAKKIRALGFEVRRNLEFDGFDTGVDLIVGDLPLALQCKAGKDPRAVFCGLREAQAARPDARAHVSIQSLHRDGFRPRLQILASYQLPDMEARKEGFITWTAFKTLLAELSHLTS